MDEIEIVSDLMGVDGPPRQVTARGRQRLAELAGSEFVPAARRLRRPRLLVPSVGILAAAAVAVAVTVSVGDGKSSKSAVAVTPGRAELSARTVLLAAAEKAEQQPTGRYWYSDQVTGQSYLVNARTGTYAIVGAHAEYFQWVGAKTGDGTGFYGRDLPARPLTRSDEQAWRRAGSPSSFRVWSNDHYATYTTKAGSWQPDSPDPRGGGRFFLQGTGRKMTLEQLQNLPTDPARLAEIFFSPQAFPGLLRNRVPQTRVVPPAAKIGEVAGILQSAPVSPAVRAGLMRALLQQPGIRAIGTVTDPLGREGTGMVADIVPLTSSSAGGTTGHGDREEIIFSRETGDLLAEEEVLTRPGGIYRDQQPGFLINYSVTRDSHWTDAVPKPSARLPF